MESAASEKHEEGEEEQQQDEDETPYCPFFSNSELFAFMTKERFLREEEIAGVDESSFQFVRPMRAKLSILENPHGSVRFWQGLTCVIAAVYGPSDVRMSKELPHRAAVDVLFRPKVTGSGNMSAMLAAGLMDPLMEERAIEQTVVGILESVIHLEDHVQAGFNVILHEIENDGCLVSACVNATVLALLSAGCSLRNVVCAVTLGVSGDSVVVDPCAKQIQDIQKSMGKDACKSNGLLTFVLTNSHGFVPQILHVSCKGRVLPSELKTCYKLVCSGKIVQEVVRFFYLCISKDLKYSEGNGVEKIEEQVEMEPGEVESSSGDEVDEDGE
ncbi:Exosome complex component RRP46 [Orchesella cincta]|uniref:Exosome complex component RRP46 n=1 Tax=Orchesella cincta TaxID=48709 RepID=A0A1D2MM99_ORCCI|nr:Exosome complex component RRP46 [Orchesella cincta]